MEEQTLRTTKIKKKNFKTDDSEYGQILEKQSLILPAIFDPKIAAITSEFLSQISPEKTRNSSLRNKSMNTIIPKEAPRLSSNALKKLDMQTFFN